MKILLIGLLFAITLFFVLFRFVPLGWFLPFAMKDKPQIAGSIQIQRLNGTAYYLYLPPEYLQEPDASFGTLYHLHGAMPFGWTIAKQVMEVDIRTTAALQEQMVLQGQSIPKIIVAPYDGVGTSMWSDSFDGKIEAERFLISHLIDEIENRYRVKTARKDRIIQGFSMGGFGALKIAFKYPELFRKAISWDGALHSWETLSKHRKRIAQEVFSSEAHFNQHSPMQLSVRYGEKQEKLPLELYIIQGALTIYNEDFRKHLLSQNLNFHFVETECGHDLSCMMKAETTHIAYYE